MISVPASPNPVLGCYVYVDGQYVRKQFRDDAEPDQFDPTEPAAYVTRVRIAGSQLVPTRIFYYDAVKEGAPDEMMQRTYFKRVARAKYSRHRRSRAKSNQHSRAERR